MSVGCVDEEKDILEGCGKLVELFYTSNSYDEDCLETNKRALVYLPTGYEKGDESYNLLVLMHGGGCDETDLFGGVEGCTDLKGILDHMIRRGEIEPLIVVTPTFYFQGTEEALTSTKDARLLTENFHQELIKDLLPAVENRFRVKNSRENRGFGGFSMGSEATWNVFARCLREFKYFLPMCGDYWVVQLKGGQEYPVETVDHLVSAVEEAGVDFKIAACVGDRDIAYEPMDSMLQEMKKREVFTFGEDFLQGNVVYHVHPGGQHVREYLHIYVKKVLPMFFREQ